MKIQKIAVTLALAPVLLLSAAAQASNSCKLTISATNVSIVWNQNFSFSAVSFTLNKGKKQACSFGIGFTKGGASDYTRRMLYATRSLSYQLYKDSSLTTVLKDLPDSNGAENILTGSLPAGAGQSMTLTYYVSIPVDQATTPSYKPSGTYTDTFSLKTYETNALGVLDPASSQAQNVALSTSIPKIIELSLVPPGGSFNLGSNSQVLNFGTLTAGKSMGLDLKVRTNAGYSVALSSQNNGMLRSPTSPTSTPVPYTMSVNAAAQDLANSATVPVVVTTGSGQTSTQGLTNPLAITIGSESGSLAGSYSDNITVTVTTTE